MDFVAIVIALGFFALMVLLLRDFDKGIEHRRSSSG